MRISCYIIDDEEHAIEIVARYINKTPNLELIGSETNPLLALDKIISGEVEPDITFLDMDMPQLSGIELAGLINQRTKIIITTAFEKFAVKAFEENVIDYLLKPITYQRFLKAVNKMKEQYIGRNKNSQSDFQESCFFIQSEVKGKLLKIMYNEVYYIEALLNYIKVHLDKKSHLTYLTMKEMEENLPSAEFVRIHRSYIINISKLKSIEGSKVLLMNGVMLDIGSNYHKEFQKMINKKLIKSKRSP
jgi:two-component system, LytTR family, response regulator